MHVHVMHILYDFVFVITYIVLCLLVINAENAFTNSILINVTF